MAIRSAAHGCPPMRAASALMQRPCADWGGAWPRSHLRMLVARHAHHRAHRAVEVRSIALITLEEQLVERYHVRRLNIIVLVGERGGALRHSTRAVRRQIVIAL